MSGNRLSPTDLWLVVSWHIYSHIVAYIYGCCTRLHHLSFFLLLASGCWWHQTIILILNDMKRTGLRGFLPGPTQTGLYCHRKSRENKGADQLCSYCTADLRLCFRLDKNLFFSDDVANRPSFKEANFFTAGSLNGIYGIKSPFAAPKGFSNGVYGNFGYFYKRLLSFGGSFTHLNNT